MEEKRSDIAKGDRVTNGHDIAVVIGIDETTGSFTVKWERNGRMEVYPHDTGVLSLLSQLPLKDRLFAEGNLIGYYLS